MAPGVLINDDSLTPAQAALLERRLCTVPLGLWAAATCARVFARSEVALRFRSDALNEHGRRLGFRTSPEDPAGDSVLRLDPLCPFVAPEALLAESRTPGPLERFRVEDDQTFELARALARGLGRGHETVRGPLSLALGFMGPIEALVTDVDGCLTDGSLGRTDAGATHRLFNTKDGIGHHLLIDAGVKVAWLSTANEGESIRHRAESLGLDVIDVGRGSKGPRFLRICERLGVLPARTVFLGDDTTDLPAMEQAGASACPADAHPDVRAAADVVLESPGGRGAFREAADLVLAAR